MDTKKLRQKILDLAIHGKLVPQDPNDEPASVLLERIRVEKERLIKEGKIKRGKKSATTSDTPHYENVPFEVPEGWVWTTVAEISKSILYGVSESAKTSGAYKLLRITDIQENNVDWDTVPFTDYDESKVGIYLLEENDILFARTGATVGKSYLVKGLCESSIYASYLIRVQTFKEILPQYVKYFFESGFYWEQIERSSIGIGQPNVNGTTLGNLRLPIPPINEQERIVSELKKWIAVITSIEANKNDLQGYIESAKSKILDLAIHGKLVPQDPNDEPANDLLRRINPQFTPCDNGQYEKLPKNWVSAKGLDIFSPMKSARPQGEYFDYIDIDSIDNKRQRIIAPKHMLSADAPSRASRFTHKGDTIFSMVRPYLKNIALVPKSDCIASTGFYVCSSNGSLDIQYCYYMMISPAIVDGLNSFMKGDNSPSITKKELDAFVFPVPPLAEQQRIVACIEELFAMLDTIQASLT